MAADLNKKLVLPNPHYLEYSMGEHMSLSRLLLISCATIKRKRILSIISTSTLHALHHHKSQEERACLLPTRSLRNHLTSQFSLQLRIGIISIDLRSIHTPMALDLLLRSLSTKSITR
jgi:hypothetical protein